MYLIIKMQALLTCLDKTVYIQKKIASAVVEIN